MPYFQDAEGARIGERACPRHSRRRIPHVWDSMARPSTRLVATKLRQSGASISHMTVARWRSRGWRPLEREQHPLDVAREQLDDAVPILTGDPTTVVEDLVKVSGERAELENLPDAASRTARTIQMLMLHQRSPAAGSYSQRDKESPGRAGASSA